MMRWRPRSRAGSCERMGSTVVIENQMLLVLGQLGLAAGVRSRSSWTTQTVNVRTRFFTAAIGVRASLAPERLGRAFARRVDPGGRVSRLVASEFNSPVRTTTMPIVVATLTCGARRERSDAPINRLAT